MSPDYLTDANLQKKSSSGGDAEPSQNFCGRLDPPPVEPDSFDLAIASLVDRKIGAGNSYPRAPLGYDGVPLNFCKSPTCPNFASPSSRNRARATEPQEPSRYPIIASSKGLPMARCNACRESFLRALEIAD